MATRLRDLPSAADIVAHPELLRGELHTDEPCPTCGAPLQLILDDPHPFAACSGCEFCVRLTFTR